MEVGQSTSSKWAKLQHRNQTLAIGLGVEQSTADYATLSGYVAGGKGDRIVGHAINGECVGKFALHLAGRSSPRLRSALSDKLRRTLRLRPGFCCAQKCVLCSLALGSR